MVRGETNASILSHDVQVYESLKRKLLRDQTLQEQCRALKSQVNELKAQHKQQKKMLREQTQEIERLKQMLAEARQQPATAISGNAVRVPSSPTFASNAITSPVIRAWFAPPGIGSNLQANTALNPLNARRAVPSLTIQALYDSPVDADEDSFISDGEPPKVPPAVQEQLLAALNDSISDEQPSVLPGRSKRKREPEPDSAENANLESQETVEPLAEAEMNADAGKSEQPAANNTSDEQTTISSAMSPSKRPRLHEPDSAENANLKSQETAEPLAEAEKNADTGESEQPATTQLDTAQSNHKSNTDDSVPNLNTTKSAARLNSEQAAVPEAEVRSDASTQPAASSDSNSEQLTKRSRAAAKKPAPKSTRYATRRKVTEQPSDASSK